MHLTILPDQAIEIRVVHRPRYHMHPMAAQRVAECRELPPAKMRGKKQHALAAGMRPLVVLEPVIHHDLLNILPRVLGKVADLRQLTSQRGKLGAKNLNSLRLRFFRKCQGEIAHAHLTQARVQKINQPRQPNAGGSRQRARQNTEDFDERPGCRVLKSLPHRGKRDGITVKNCLSNRETLINHGGRQGPRRKASCDFVFLVVYFFTSMLLAPTVPVRSETRWCLPVVRSPPSATCGMAPCGRKILGCCLCPA